MKKVEPSIALDMRKYLFNLMRVKKLTTLCEELQRKYNPTDSTSYYDRAILTQLHNDLTVLQSTAKVWEEDQELLIT